LLYIAPIKSSLSIHEKSCLLGRLDDLGLLLKPTDWGTIGPAGWGSVGLLGEDVWPADGIVVRPAELRTSGIADGGRLGPNNWIKTGPADWLDPVLLIRNK
jgi:hypothetical protein